MANVAVIGSQWGDEGKGKVVDWLSSRADVVVRFQGGHNAGHTLVIDGKIYKLNMLPSGIVRQGKISIIGNGVVLDPWALLKEIENIRAQGVEITAQSLKIAENVPLILPVHSGLDQALEQARNKEQKIGTTGRGIGPAYEDKVGRRAIRLCDLADHDFLAERIDQMLFYHNALRRGLGSDELKKSDILEPLKQIGEQLLPHSCVMWQVMETAKKENKKILFEGAQGTMLDIDHGTYPFVTSSNIVAPQAATGGSTGLSNVNYILGITKAYTTRVGEGPFPTEQDNADGQRLGERGREFGTVTGRKRRCGWFDAVLVRQAVKVGGLNGIALTKLDVLDGFDEIRICTAYELDGERIDYLPAAPFLQKKVKPVYETVKGWSQSTQGARSWGALPAEAVKYARRIEELIEVPITLLSTSPEREDTILMQDPFSM